MFHMTKVRKHELATAILQELKKYGHTLNSKNVSFDILIEEFYLKEITLDPHSLKQILEHSNALCVKYNECEEFSRIIKEEMLKYAQKKHGQKKIADT